MSTVLRLLLLLGLLAAVAAIVVRPARLRWWGGRLRLIGFAYVAAVLISAALRAFGIVDWS
jgi:hypothetical protein